MPLPGWRPCLCPAGDQDLEVEYSYIKRKKFNRKMLKVRNAIKPFKSKMSVAKKLQLFIIPHVSISKSSLIKVFAPEQLVLYFNK
jgi:hypothetical protein